MKKKHTGTQIAAKLRQADVLIGKGKTILEVCKDIEVSQHTYYRCPMRLTHARVLKACDGPRQKEAYVEIDD